VWSNPELTCQHVDPQTSLSPGQRATIELKLLVIRGSLDDALERANGGVSSNFLKQSFFTQVWTTHGLGGSLTWDVSAQRTGTRRVVELSPRLSLRRDKTASRKPTPANSIDL
jgi:hypothetical protein